VEIREINDVDGLKFYPVDRLPEINPEETKHIEIPIEGSLELPDGLASFRIAVIEPNGFGTDPLEVEIETQAFRAPLVKTALPYHDEKHGMFTY